MFYRRKILTTSCFLWLLNVADENYGRWPFSEYLSYRDEHSSCDQYMNATFCSFSLLLNILCGERVLNACMELGYASGLTTNRRRLEHDPVHVGG